MQVKVLETADHEAGVLSQDFARRGMARVMDKGGSNMASPPPPDRARAGFFVSSGPGGGLPQ